MSPRISPRPLLGGLIYLAGAGLCAFGQTTLTATLDSANSRALSLPFYGVNGQDRGDTQWGNPSWPAAAMPAGMASMAYGVLRFPGGTGANYWDYNTGTFLSSYWDGHDASPDPSNTYPSPISELQTELAATGAEPLIVLNLLTDPTATPNASSGDDTNAGETYLAYTNPNYPGSGNYRGPKLSYQTAALTAMQSALGYVPPFVELGNEYYLSGKEGYTLVYPDGTSGTAGGANYGALIKTWLPTLKSSATYGGATPPLIAVVGAQTSGSTRMQNWLSGLFSSSGLGTAGGQEDAVTLHVYPTSGLSASTTEPVTASTAPTMLAQPFKTWLNLVQNDLTSIPSKDQVWITEYNLDDTSTPAWGTWAHGLYVASMSLLFLETQAQDYQGDYYTVKTPVTMALHHAVISNTAFYGDLIGTPNGTPDAFQQQPAPSPKQPSLPADYASFPDVFQKFSSSGSTTFLATAPGPTEQYGWTATGVAQSQINMAAARQTNAKKLDFASVPTVTVGSTTYPVVYGWNLTGAGSYQTVILNLGATAYNVDVSSYFPTIGGTFDQIAAPVVGDGAQPGVCVTGQVTAAGNPEAFYWNTSTSAWTEEDLTESTGTIVNPRAMTLPGFSITRLTSITDSDVGSPGKAGSASSSSGTWTVSGGGTIVVGNTSDKFNFAYEPLFGGTNSAQVEVQSISSGVNEYAKAGVMIRAAATDASSPFACLALEPNASTATFLYRASESAATVSAGTATISLPCWAKVTQSGTTYTGFVSTDGTHWTQVGSAETITAMGSTPVVGMAVTANNNAELNTATFPAFATP